MATRWFGSAWRVGLVALTVTGAACGGDDDAATSDAGMDSSMMDSSMADSSMMDSAMADTSMLDGSMMDSDSSVAPECDPPAPNQPYEYLSCAGLYSDIRTKTLAAGVHEFAPAVALWSDGAEKLRWIYLPPGGKIDVSDPDNWTFPVGTKFFKEFQWKGRRVETRLFWKSSANYWARTAYKWNANETEAQRSGGEDIVVDGDDYHIPSTTECDQCHGGRRDRAMGFETILLGLDGATGMNLAELRAAGLLSNDTLPTNLSLGDDGTGRGAEVAGWLHVNCGVTCHNANSGSNAYPTGLRMRLNVVDADGGSLTDIGLHTTGVGVATVTGAWQGTRVVPGNPDDSWLYKLMSSRDPVNMRDQMPPIASRVVPTEAAAMIRDWIEKL